MGAQVKITDTLLDDGTPYYLFSNRSYSANSNDLVVHVRGNGNGSWYGVFPAGIHPGIDVSGIHHWPESDKLFAVSRGSGYLVDTSDPSMWSQAHISPITWFDDHSFDDTVLVCDYRRIAAYSALGLLWKTQQLSWNGIRNLTAEGEMIKGEAWDDPWECWVSFLVDAETGKHQGGATFAML